MDIVVGVSHVNPRCEETSFSRANAISVKTADVGFKHSVSISYNARNVLRRYAIMCSYKV